MNYNPTIGETLTCPVCNESFTVSEDTKYIAAGGFTCNWKCFLVHIKSAPTNQSKTSKKRTIVNDL